jgi:ribose 5-phosphate isomerase B
MSLPKIAIGCDHAGFVLKEELKNKLQGAGYHVKDFGTYSLESVDYPDYVHPLAESVEKKENDYGILICGSANGVAMTANKHQGIRAAIAWNTEVAALARQHNNANVICLPARFLVEMDAEEMVRVFLSTAFEGGRHTRRVEKMKLEA